MKKTLKIMYIINEFFNEMIKSIIKFALKRCSLNCLIKRIRKDMLLAINIRKKRGKKSEMNSAG